MQTVKTSILGQNPLTGTFRRNYEGDYNCTEFTRFSRPEVQALVTADLEDVVDNARMRRSTNGRKKEAPA